MFRVVDYLVQAQGGHADSPELRVLDSRGGGSVAWSFVVLLGAISKLIMARLRGQLGGLHVHMAERLSVFRKGALMLTARLLGVPVILHLHAAQLEQFYAGAAAPVQALIRAIFGLADGVVVLGKSAEALVTGALRVPAECVTILINGVPGPLTAAPRAVAAVPQLLFLGNLSERKGVSDLLAALASPAVRERVWAATFAGGGEIDAYRAKAAALGLGDRIHFAGWVKQPEASKLVAAADILILPSYDEGLPLVILEALGQAVAVICTPVGEIPHVLQHGENAYFVEPGNVGQLAAAVQTLLDDAPRRLRLAVAGRALFERSFAVDVFFRSLLEIYRRYLPASLFGRQVAAEKLSEGKK